jgi:membrane-bound lytic murein transglycosylase D
MMKWCGSLAVCYILSVIVFAGCTTLSPHAMPSGERTIRPAKLAMSPAPATRAPGGVPDGEPSALSDSEERVNGEAEDEDSSIDAEEMTNQELIDSALEFCQASSDFWERGDLDSAVEALDKAYSIILKVKADDDPDLLQQKEDLRFTISKRIVEVYASRFTVAAGDHNAIPLVMNDHVQRELQSLTGRERDFFLNSYARSGRYRPAIVKALREAGMPEELSWLPLIESGFKVRALSRARALGMWQFIASTGYRFGLRRDQWIDERMDPQKSTVAAIAYLNELHKMFGDWTTALAAYNCGETAVMNRIRTQRINYLDNFWDLYQKLPRETAAYVPRLLAVLHIVKNPESYGLELPPLENGIETEEVSVAKQVLMKDVASRLGVDSNVLEELNAELRLNVTPEGQYSLKVPAGKGEELLAMIEQIPTHSPPKYAYSGTVTHMVRRGETISTIARKYRTSVAAIMAENGIRKNHALRVGAKVSVPAGAERSSARIVPTSLKKTKEEKKTVNYVVKKGDTLWQIAGRFNTTVKEIQTLNRLSNQQLYSGQILLIPGTGEKSEAGQTKIYTVQGGDSPYRIAKKHEMDLSDFLELNKLTPESTIFPGQTLGVRADSVSQ